MAPVRGWASYSLSRLKHITCLAGFIKPNFIDNCRGGMAHNDKTQPGTKKRRLGDNKNEKEEKEEAVAGPEYPFQDLHDKYEEMKELVDLLQDDELDRLERHIKEHGHANKSIQRDREVMVSDAIESCEALKEHLNDLHCEIAAHSEQKTKAATEHDALHHRLTDMRMSFYLAMKDKINTKYRRQGLPEPDQYEVGNRAIKRMNKWLSYENAVEGSEVGLESWVHHD